MALNLPIVGVSSTFAKSISNVDWSQEESYEDNMDFGFVSNQQIGCLGG
jgi:hypothetical protein